MKTVRLAGGLRTRLREEAEYTSDVVTGHFLNSEAINNDFTIQLDDSSMTNEQVERLREKPQADGSVNAGSFVLEPGMIDHLDNGFFQPADTYSESRTLNEMCASGKAPWKIWPSDA